jgi:hypothetical protein
MTYGSYCTQIGPDGQGAMRCGPACIASCLLDDGWQSDPWELTLQVTADCSYMNEGATCSEMVACANHHALDGRVWFTIDQAKQALAQGEAVLVLCDNRLLTPRSYPPGSSWEAMHWVRVVAATERDDMLYLYDPLTWVQQLDGSVYQGPMASTTQGLLNATMATGYQESGVILSSRQGRNLNSR